jgi:hypothetical protein
LELKKKNLFEFIEDFISIGEVPVKEKLINDGEVVTSLGETREYLLYIAFRFLLQ